MNSNGFQSDFKAIQTNASYLKASLLVFVVKRKENVKEPSMTTKIDSAVMTVLDIKAAGCYKR